MKRRHALVVFVLMFTLIFSMSTLAFAAEEGTSLDDVINNNSQQTQIETKTSGTTSDGDKQISDREQKNQNFIAGINKAADLSGQVDGVEEATSGLRFVAAWVVQVLAYGLTVLLAVRVMLDLTYIGLPFTRSFLANGYAGNAQAGAGGMPNSMQGGPGMGMGGMGGMGMGGGYGGRYGGMGGMGMGGMGMGGGMGMQGGMQPANMNQGNNIAGRIQWVSNAALNAVAGESTVDPSGKPVGPFKRYMKDMVVVLVMVPILITLAVTGTLTSLGFLIGDLLVDAISGIGDML